MRRDLRSLFGSKAVSRCVRRARRLHRPPWSERFYRSPQITSASQPQRASAIQCGPPRAAVPGLRGAALPSGPRPSIPDVERVVGSSSLTTEAEPAWIAPFGSGLELGQPGTRPFPIVRIDARSRQIIVTQPHQGPSAARLKQKFDRRLPRRDARDATPGNNDFAIGHNLDVVTFDLLSAGFRQAKDATRNGIGIDDFGLPFPYLCRNGEQREDGLGGGLDVDFLADFSTARFLAHLVRSLVRPAPTQA